MVPAFHTISSFTISMKVSRKSDGYFWFVHHVEFVIEALVQQGDDLHDAGAPALGNDGDEHDAAHWRTRGSSDYPRWWRSRRCGRRS